MFQLYRTGNEKEMHNRCAYTKVNVKIRLFVTRCRTIFEMFFLCILPIDMVSNLVQTDKNKVSRFQRETLFSANVPCYNHHIEFLCVSEEVHVHKKDITGTDFKR